MSVFKVVTGRGQDIVIFHGGCNNHDDMQPVVEMLSSTYRITNLSLPGSGYSDWNPAIKSVHDIADEILPALPEQAIYIGWSFGGLVAQSIAARYPEQVVRLIGIGTTPKFLKTEDWPGFPSSGYSAIIFPLLAEGKDSRFFVQGFYEAEFSSFSSKPQTYAEIQKINARRKAIEPKLVKKLVAIVDSTDLRQEFQSIHCPIDLIFGNHDLNVPIAAFEHIKKLNSRVKIYEIAGAQHAPFWTHGEQFKKILQEILCSTQI